MAQFRIHHRDWILIGDGKKALLLINEGDADLLNLRRLSMTEQESAPTHEQGTDRPGRSFSSGSPGRSSYQQTDWHTLDEERFAHEMAHSINHAALAHDFDRLIVIAPPKTLGELRAAFSPQAQTKIIAEIAKDLTGHSMPDIEKLLTSYEE